MNMEALERDALLREFEISKDLFDGVPKKAEALVAVLTGEANEHKGSSNWKFKCRKTVARNEATPDNMNIVFSARSNAPAYRNPQGHKADQPDKIDVPGDDTIEIRINLTKHDTERPPKAVVTGAWSVEVKNTADAKSAQKITGTLNPETWNNGFADRGRAKELEALFDGSWEAWIRQQFAQMIMRRSGIQFVRAVA